MGPNLTDWGSYKKRRSGHRQTEGTPCETQREDGVSKPRRETPEETNPTDVLTSDFQLQGCKEISFCCLSCLLCGLCMAALAD